MQPAVHALWPLTASVLTEPVLQSINGRGRLAHLPAFFADGKFSTKLLDGTFLEAHSAGGQALAMLSRQVDKHKHSSIRRKRGTSIVLKAGRQTQAFF